MPETGQVVKLKLECLECAAHEYRRVRPRVERARLGEAPAGERSERQ